MVDPSCFGAALRRLRSDLAIVACFALAIMTWGAPARAAVCYPQTGSYRVDVKIDIPPVKVHHDRSRAELGLLAIHGPTNRILGVTASKLRAGSSTHYGHKPLESGGNCFWVDHIEVVLRYEMLDIYIASDYGRYSCQYQAILTHEEKHAAVAKAHLNNTVQLIRSALSSLVIPKARAPKLVGSVTEARDQTQATIEKLLQPVIEKLRRDMAEAQKKIDSRHEYRRVEKQCKKW